jgi:prevent-host-death family protein
MSRWPLQDAKQRLSALVDRALREGPQTITRHGAEAAVVVSAKEWRSLTAKQTRSIKELLLSRPRNFVDDLDELIGPRRALRFDRRIDV